MLYQGVAPIINKNNLQKNNILYIETLSVINSTVSDAVVSQCDCGADITIGLSHSTRLKCFPGDQRKIVLVTTAYGINETIQQVEKMVKKWPMDTSSPISATAGSNVLALTAVCLEEHASNTTCFVAQAGMSDHDDSDDDGSSKKVAIAGVIVPVIIIFILIIVVIIVILVIIYHKRRQSYK